MTQNVDETTRVPDITEHRGSPLEHFMTLILADVLLKLYLSWDFSSNAKMDAKIKGIPRCFISLENLTMSMS